MQFIPLHGHTVYSLRDGVATIPELVQQAIALKYPACAVTEHGTLSSAIYFYKECRKYNIKPILGCEFYLANRSRFQKEHPIDTYYHLTVLAMNNTGWKNLCTLVTESYSKDAFYRKPRIDRELLRKYNDGLIVLSGCVGSLLSHHIMLDIGVTFDDEEGNSTTVECAAHTEQVVETKEDSYDDIIKWFKSVFGDRYYLEVQNHNILAESKVAEVILNSYKKYDVKVVATSDFHFIKKEDVEVHDTMLAIRSNVLLNDPKFAKIKYPGSGYHLLTTNEIRSKFVGFDEVIYNTEEIADRCNVELELDKIHMPVLYDPYTEDAYFEQHVKDSLKIKMNITKIPLPYMSRLNMEITTIKQMGFISYFLMVADYMQYARNNDIPAGPGRGSAAGSLVSYALGITDIDPLKYNLSFSRFLNKGRAAKPRIDFKEFSLADFKELKRK